MATPGELISATAAALGLAEVTVSTYFKALREAGLTTRGGRGRSAPQMTVRDATHLLVAIAASDTALNAPAAVHKFCALPVVMGKRTTEIVLGRSSGNFGETVENILRLQIDGKLQEALDAVPRDWFQELSDFEREAGLPPGVSIPEIGSAEDLAMDTMTMLEFEVERHLEVAHISVLRPAYVRYLTRQKKVVLATCWGDRKERRVRSGLWIQATVLHRAIRRIADCLRTQTGGSKV